MKQNFCNPKKNMTMKIIKRKEHEKDKFRFQATISKVLTLLFCFNGLD